MTYSLRDIDVDDPAEIALVASRMRQTLVEVLGEERGGSMYSMEWLIDRVMFHLDPTVCTGRVVLAVSDNEEILGHTIMRVQDDEALGRHGLFSTFYIVSKARGHGIAKAFLELGEDWMKSVGMTASMTCTDKDNVPLISLMRSSGYEVVLEKDDMVVLCKQLIVPHEPVYGAN